MIYSGSAAEQRQRELWGGARPALRGQKPPIRAGWGEEKSFQTEPGTPWTRPASGGHREGQRDAQADNHPAGGQQTAAGENHGETQQRSKRSWFHSSSSLLRRKWFNKFSPFICISHTSLSLSLSVRVSECDLKRRDPGSEGSAGGAERANTEGGAGRTASWKRYKIRAGSKPTKLKETGGRSMKLFKLFSFINVLMIKFSLLGMNGLHTVTFV